MPADWLPVKVAIDPLTSGEVARQTPPGSPEEQPPSRSAATRSDSSLVSFLHPLYRIPRISNSRTHTTKDTHPQSDEFACGADCALEKTPRGGKFPSSLIGSYPILECVSRHDSPQSRARLPRMTYFRRHPVPLSHGQQDTPYGNVIRDKRPSTTNRTSVSKIAHEQWICQVLFPEEPVRVRDEMPAEISSTHDLRQVVATFDAVDRQVGVRQVVTGGSNALRLEECHLPVGEQEAPRALPAPPALIRLDRHVIARPLADEDLGGGTGDVARSSAESRASGCCRSGSGRPWRRSARGCDRTPWNRSSWWIRTWSGRSDPPDTAERRDCSDRRWCSGTAGPTFASPGPSTASTPGSSKRGPGHTGSSRRESPAYISTASPTCLRLCEQTTRRAADLALCSDGDEDREQQRDDRDHDQKLDERESPQGGGE